MKNNKVSKLKYFINFKTILGIIISILCLWWAFNDLELTSLSKSINEIRYYYLILATLLLWISVWLRAIRWKYLFQVSNPPEVPSLYRSEMIGYFGNNVLPLRLGELLRAYIIGREWKLSKTYVFGTVILERVLDAMSLILLALLLIFIYPLEPILIKNILCISFSTIIIFVFAWKLLHGMRVMKSNGIYIKYFKDMIEGAQSIDSRSIFPIVLLSALIWGIYLVDVYLLQCAFEFNLSFSQILMVLVFSTMALALPAAPGMVGTYHAAVKYCIVDILGYSSMNGNAFALVMHAYGYILLTLIGSYYFMRSQFDVSSIQSIIENE